MLPLLSPQQIRQVDQLTLSEQQIGDHELMWRAASRLFQRMQPLIESHKLRHAPVYIFSGPSNNGGDGLVIARLFMEQTQHPVHVFVLNRNGSPSFVYYLKQVEELLPVQLLLSPADFPEIAADAIILDALFGTGLNRPLEGIAAALVDYLSQRGGLRIAVDLPSGLYVDRVADGPVFHAHHTFTVQLPKLSLLMAENADCFGDWEVVDIGLSENAIRNAATNYYVLETADVAALLQPRARFAHKGHFGHVLLFAGREPTAGAAVLAAQACVRTGAGLTTVLVPASLRSALNAAVPEAMTLNRERITAEKLQRFTVLAAGPGIGTDMAEKELLQQLLMHFRKPAVLDADALTLLARHELLWKWVPPHSILTPHAGELARVVGTMHSWQDRLARLQELAATRNSIVILKGAFSAIAAPDGKVFFNPTGNSSMAKGGSGDVLTGMLAAWLAQGYAPVAAAQLGVFVHGLCGDLAAGSMGQWSVTATDLVHHIGNALLHVQAR